MIRLEAISKQNGHHLLFIEASAALWKGEKVGLVGPNGAGKTTLFRMIAGQEPPDEGQVSVDRGVTIGYFSQDVGEMAGRSAVAEVMDGAGPVSARRRRAQRTGSGDGRSRPGRRHRRDHRALRRGAGPVRGARRLRARGQAREVLAGLSFSEEMMDGDVGALSGGWKMRVALARILLMRPDAMLLDEPSNHLDLESLIWLEAFLKGYEGALLMTSHDREFMNRVVTKIVEIDGGALTTLFRRLRVLRTAARAEREAAAGAVRAPAGDAGQGNQVHRALQGARLACGAGAEPGQEAGQDRARRAAAPPPDRSLFEFPPAPRSGEDVATLKRVDKGYGARSIYEGLDFQVRRRERWA